MSVETPTGIWIGHWPAGSDEWLAARSNGLGGSEIAAVLGLSPFDSAYSLWCLKRGITGPKEATDQMRWGNYCEPSLLAWYNDFHGQIRTEVGMFRHEDRPWQLANPDAVAVDRIVEAKTSLDSDAWGKPGTAAVPPYYRCQKLWYMDVLGIDRCDLIATIRGLAPQLWTMEYDAEDAAYLREKAKDFLDLVDTGAEPEIDGHEQTYKVIRSLHPEIEPKAKWYLDDETAEPFLLACADEKASKTAKRQAAARILRAMGTAQYAYYGKQKVAIRMTTGDGDPYLKAS